MTHQNEYEKKVSLVLQELEKLRLVSLLPRPTEELQEAVLRRIREIAL